MGSSAAGVRRLQSSAAPPDRGGNARRRGARLLAGLALLGAMPVSAAAAPPPSGMFDPRDPVYAAGHAQAVRDQQAWRASRQDPQQRRERAASRQAHRDLGRDAALRLAREQFPERFSRDAADPLVLPNGLRISRFLAADTAAVETATGQSMGVLMSLAPVGVERDGRLIPISLGLERRADRYVPADPGVPYSLPQHAGGPARLERSGVAFRAAGASGVEAGIAGNRLFFAEGGGQDTDYVLEPQSAGAEAMWQLRSDRSPEVFGLDFDLPAGARLELDGASLGGRRAEMGARIVAADGRPLATITPPLAYDSDGTRVPVDTAVNGSRLEMTVRHRGRDLAYPLLLDPQVAEVWGRATGFEGCGTAGTGGAWSPEQYYGNGHGYAFVCDARSLGWGYGLYAGQYTNGYYIAGSFAQWNWYPPRDAFIDYVWWDNTRHQTAYDNYGYSGYTYAHAGIYQNGCCWRAFTEWGNSAHWGFSQWANADIDNTRAVIGIRTMVTGSYYDPGLVGLEGAYIIVNDNYAPADIHLNSFVAGSQGLQNSTIGSPYRESPWVNPSSTPIKISAHAWDRGLGLKSITYVRSADLGTPLWGPFSSNCNGSKSSPCPNSVDTAQTEVTGARTMPEGIWEAKLLAADINDKVGYGYDPVNLKIDRTAPSIGVAEAAQIDGQTLWAPSYRLSIDAIDGYTDRGPSGYRSGVTRIRVSVDGAVRYDQSWSCVNSCRRQVAVDLRTDTLGEAGGRHEVRVEAWDQLGHRSARYLYPTYYPTSNHFGGDNDAVDAEAEMDALGQSLATRGDYAAVWSGLALDDKNRMLSGYDVHYESWAPRIDRTSPGAVGQFGVSGYESDQSDVEVHWSAGDDPDIEPGVVGSGDDGDAEYRLRRDGGEWGSWRATADSGFSASMVQPGEWIDVEVRGLDRAGNAAPVASYRFQVPDGPEADASLALAIPVAFVAVGAVSSIAVWSNGQREYRVKEVPQGTPVRISRTPRQSATMVEDQAEWQARQERQRGSMRRKLDADPDEPPVRPNEQAHHVVAIKHAKARYARWIMFRCGMELNDVTNGVAVDTRIHRAMHREDDYYNWVEEMLREFDPLRGIDPCGGLDRRRLIGALERMKEYIRDGKAPARYRVQ